jgi:hypothetical protein
MLTLRGVAEILSVSDNVAEILIWTVLLKICALTGGTMGTAIIAMTIKASAILK